MCATCTCVRRHTCAIWYALGSKGTARHVCPHLPPGLRQVHPEMQSQVLRADWPVSSWRCSCLCLPCNCVQGMCIAGIQPRSWSLHSKWLHPSHLPSPGLAFQSHTYCYRLPYPLPSRNNWWIWHASPHSFYCRITLLSANWCFSMF